MKFKVNGKEFQCGGPNAAVLKINKYLDRLSDGSLVTANKLTADVGYSMSHFTNALSHRFSEYRIRDGRRFIYGSKKTIKALKDAKI